MRAHSRLTRWAITGSIALMVSGGLAGVTLSPLFSADEIEVHGIRNLRADQVRRIAGLAVGANVIYADLSLAVERLERNGWVADASARRELPARIVIDITERLPVGLVMIDGRKKIVTTDGTVIDSWMPGLPRILPSLGSEATSVAAAAAALAELPEATRHRVATASIQPDGSLSLQLERGIGVTYGPPVELKAKGLALAELLSWADETGARVTFVDVTVPQAPTARIGDGGIANREATD